MLQTTDGIRTFVSIKTKPTGVPDIVRKSWDDYKGKAEPFFHHVPTQPHGYTRTDLVKREAFLGLGFHVKERQRQDAANSLLLHRIGVKTRLPISGWNVDAFMVWDDLEQKLVPRDVEWLKQQGLDDDELYHATWGLSCPITLEDVNDFLSFTVNLPEEHATPVFIEFVTVMKDLAQKDIFPKYQVLSEELKAVFNNGNELDLKQVAEVLKMFGLALARTAGRNFERMYRNDTGKSYTHGVLHDQNISFFGEWCDSFTLHEGLIEVGLAPENSCLLYTSPSPRDRTRSRMPSSA